jgi:hypothetical protein
MIRRIIIHDHPHAAAALAVATELGVAIILQSAPGAAGYLGAGYFRGLEVVLDCGDSPGHALAALRAGVKRFRLRGGPEVLRRVADIANQLGAELEADEAVAALDLGTVAPSRWAEECRAWLMACS